MDTKTGGPAFPHEYKYGDGTAHREDGMSLRDYFAAKALQGLLACPEEPGAPDDLNWEKYLAELAYGYADAMLTAREARHD